MSKTRRSPAVSPGRSITTWTRRRRAAARRTRPRRCAGRAQADLARLRALALELGHLAEGAGALAAHLSDSLVFSYHSDDFDEAEQARQSLSAVVALRAVLRRTAGDAQDRLAGIDPELPGLLTMGEI